MNEKNQIKLLGLLAIFIFLIILIIGFVYLKTSHKETPLPNFERNDQSSIHPQIEKFHETELLPTHQEEADIILFNLGLRSFEDVDVNMNALREYQSKGLKGFYFFGDNLTGGRLNPNLEYSSLKQNTEIISAIDGIVAFIKDQNDFGRQDYELIIKPSENSVWTLAYDHVINLKVKKGDNVSVGQILGNPSIQNNGLYRFEFQVNKDEDNQTTHICPVTLLDNQVKNVQLQALSKMMSDWNTKSKLPLYDISMQDPVGCLYPTLTLEQAEGK